MVVVYWIGLGKGVVSYDGPVQAVHELNIGRFSPFRRGRERKFQQVPTCYQNYEVKD